MMVYFTTTNSSITWLYFYRVSSYNFLSSLFYPVSFSFDFVNTTCFFDSSSFSKQVMFIRSFNLLYFIS